MVDCCTQFLDFLVPYPRYKLLLDTLLEKTTPDHPDYQKLRGLFLASLIDLSVAVFGKETDV